MGAGLGSAGAAASPVEASSPAASSLAFFREAAVEVDFSRGRRGARAGFSLSFSLGSFPLGLGVSVVSSSFLRRDRLAAETRRLEASGLASISTGPSVLGRPGPGGSVDMVESQVANDKLARSRRRS